ncbi:MAG TPA: hypothetical protein ENI72_03820 [Rhodospirillales bacterium]|nr:hypothetical protein [Rhodospirillales bacterium]
MFFPVLFLGLFLAACTAPEPYVYKEREFDRSAEDFAKDPVDISEVVICYGKNGTTPQAIRKIARQECSKFGRTPQFVRQTYNLCPLSTPISAIYSCNLPGGAKSGSPLGGGTATGVIPPGSFDLPDWFYKPKPR